MSTRHAEIGLLLKKARQDMRYSSNQASAKLHIRVRYLEALEEGNFDKLPGTAYVQGYLRSYASFLHLDPEEMIRQFDAASAEIKSQTLYFPQVVNKDKTPSRAIIWGSLAVAFGAYLLWWALAAPHEKRISSLDPWPQNTALSASDLDKIACLHPQEALYPPCTVRVERFSLIPPQGQPATIMDLAHD